MIPRLRPDVGLRELKAALMRPYNVADFEASFAALSGHEYAIAFPYGRTGQLFLIEALGLKGQEIICPAYTCVVVAHAIVYSGNTPVFVDSEANGFNMALDQVEDAITDRTGAIIATSIHGYSADLERLDILKRKYPHIQIIQDCAHSFFASWKGRPVQKQGIAAFVGLNISKLMTSVFGGMVVTDDSNLAGRLKMLRDSRLESTRARNLIRLLYFYAATAALHPVLFSFVDRIRRAGIINTFTEYYRDDVIDMPGDYLVSLSEVEASVGVVQCGRYPDIIAHRRKIAKLYDEILVDCPNFECPPIIEGATYSHYVGQTSTPKQLNFELAKRGVELGHIIDYCIPDMPAYQEYAKSSAGFPRTRALNASVVNLPIWVSERRAEKIAEKVIGAQSMSHA